MSRKEQNKILYDKVESNNNQYEIDRLNAEISANSSGDLNKYEFLTRKDLKYKPNALDKAKFEFSPLGKTFSAGLDKTAVGYQEEGVIKLLKDIRDGLRGGVNRPNDRPDNNDDNNDDSNDDNNDDNNDRPNRPDNNDDNNGDNNDRPNKPDNDDFILEYKHAINDLLDEIERININNREYINKIKNQNDKILDLETKLKDNKLLAKEILDETGKVINKFKEDSLKRRNNYIGELAKSNDLYRQLGQVREEYEQHTRYFDEEVIGNYQTIDMLIKNSEFFKKLDDEHKHII